MLIRRNMFNCFLNEVLISQIEIRECMLSLGAEFVVFQFAIQKLKD
jgi:hypothetical protein